MKFASGVWVLVLAGMTSARAAPQAHAIRRSGAITVDGRLDEGAWASAPRHGGFTQRFPKDGAQASLETTFAVIYDDQAIYVGVWARDLDPTKIRRLLTRRDVDSPSDNVIVAFDSYHDRRTAYGFQLNAAGVQRDVMLSNDSSEDWSWDAVWTGGAEITPDGWCAEFRIPLGQLRFAGGARQVWGLQVVRTVSRTREQMAWSPWPRSGSQVVSKFGDVDGIDDLGHARRLELLPYATGGLVSEPVAPGDPLHDPLRPTANLGLDLKLGLGPAFTVSATVNPDFGQVEADPSRVNLSANELFFEEKRPFFVEGADLFRISVGVTNGGIEGSFYSRRIGAPPPVRVDGEFVDAPPFVTIYNATKLTGKTRSGWSVGVLDAVTAEETADVVTADVRSQPVVSPLTNYTVARLKRDFGEGTTSVGLSATGVQRRLAGTGLEGLLHDQAYTGGAQFETRWGKNAWQANLSLVGSYVHGSPEALTRTQRSQAHLFQRPDSRLTVDPDQTGMAGLGFGWLAGKLGDTKWLRYGIGGDLRTPGLELNDVGFLRNANQMVTFYMVEIHDEAPGELLLNYTLNTDVFTVSNFEPMLIDVGWEMNGNAQLTNYWSVNADANWIRTPWQTGALRGGPMRLRWDPSASGSFFVNSDSRRRVQIGFGGSANRTWNQASLSGGADLGLTIQARSNIDLFVGPSWSRTDDAMQYVDAPLDEAGRPHYVFARIDQTTLGVTTRLNWTFSPRLSLQAYAQPFVATGRYSAYKDIDDPGARRFEDRFTRLQGADLIRTDGAYTATSGGTFTFGRPDFSFAQLRSNVVLRWEYRPGSSVFAIWSHGQTHADDDGRFALGRGLRDLVREDAEDVVMLKANYWIGL